MVNEYAATDCEWQEKAQENSTPSIVIMGIWLDSNAKFMLSRGQGSFSSVDRVEPGIFQVLSSSWENCSMQVSMENWPHTHTDEQLRPDKPRPFSSINCLIFRMVDALGGHNTMLLCVPDTFLFSRHFFRELCHFFHPSHFHRSSTSAIFGFSRHSKTHRRGLMRIIYKLSDQCLIRSHQSDYCVCIWCVAVAAVHFLRIMKLHKPGLSNDKLR